MDPHVSKLIDGLPIEIKEPNRTSIGTSLQALLKDLSKRPVPVGRFNRGWIFGALQAKVAAGYMAHWIRSGFGGAEEKERQLNETRLKAALQLLGGMGYMRGAIMKMGQILSNYPHLAPDEFAGFLSLFHFEAPPMHFSLLREFVRDEWGADPEELFEEFDTRAFAAASLGQVHRARIKGGEEVAVKIQYPGIARTIQQDLNNLKLLLFPMRLNRDWDNFQEQVDDIIRMLTMETDYEQEAESLRHARSAFMEDEGIIIPKVYGELSTKRVLTMEFVEGLHLKPFLATKPSQKIRDQYGEKIWLVSLRLNYAKNVIYADPHPGNFFFRPDGKLGVVDFGCCHHLTDDDLDYLRETELAVQTSREAVLRTFPRTVQAKPGHRYDPPHMDFIVQYADWLWEPMDCCGPFDFGDPDYIGRGMELLSDGFKRRYLRSRPLNSWVTRSFLGARAMLYFLKARFDAGALLKRETTVHPDEGH
jgi:tRNA A-37 threonylcarbamoyl transferase component Bud32